MIEVLTHRRNVDVAYAFAQQLRSKRKSTKIGAAEYFDPDQIDSDVTQAYHDGLNPLVPWAYEQRGIPCDLIPGCGGETVHGPSEPDYRVEENRGWYKLVGPDGQVGKSQRSEDEAWALMDEV